MLIKDHLASKKLTCLLPCTLLQLHNATMKVNQGLRARSLAISQKRSLVAICYRHQPATWEACHIEPCSALSCWIVWPSWNVSSTTQVQMLIHTGGQHWPCMMLRPSRRYLYSMNNEKDNTCGSSMVIIHARCTQSSLCHVMYSISNTLVGPWLI